MEFNRFTSYAKFLSSKMKKEFIEDKITLSLLDYTDKVFKMYATSPSYTPAMMFVIYENVYNKLGKLRFPKNAEYTFEKYMTIIYMSSVEELYDSILRDLVAIDRSLDIRIKGRIFFFFYFLYDGERKKYLTTKFIEEHKIKMYKKLEIFDKEFDESLLYD